MRASSQNACVLSVFLWLERSGWVKGVCAAHRENSSNKMCRTHYSCVRCSTHARLFGCLPQCDACTTARITCATHARASHTLVEEVLNRDTSNLSASEHTHMRGASASKPPCRCHLTAPFPSHLFRARRFWRTHSPHIDMYAILAGDVAIGNVFFLCGND